MYLHEQDLVYRDIKPQNVGFTSKSSDKVKLYDFGLCRQTSECSDDEIAGTFRYMAPERMVFRRKALIRKSSSDISVILDPAASDDDNEERASMLSRQKSDLLKAADVYSIGVLMWEVATLEQPYQDLLSQKKMMRSDLYMKLGSQGWRHSTEQISCVPLRELIEQCWHVDPTKRPTMTEISKTLNEILSSTL
jgi:serine/threonine protein kinase